MGTESEMDITDWQDSGVTISLMLTRRCNFECEHCFYECGPRFRGYMGDVVLGAVYGQVLRLQGLGIQPRINLIGGEPTLNLDKFACILDRTMGWGVSVEMTTNGWWMHRPDTARRFFQAVVSHVDPDGEGAGGGFFSVRVSNDTFHDQFRPVWLQGGDRLAHKLESYWEFDEDGVFYKEIPTCGECGREHRWMPDGEQCTKRGCDGVVEYETEVVMDPLPRPRRSDPWIYVQEHTGTQYVIPTGRGQYCGGSNDRGKTLKGYCNAGLTYLPNGKLMDVCCSGSWCEFGDARDDPVLLLELARRFVRQVGPSCWGCRDDAKEWGRRNLRGLGAVLQAKIDRRDEHDLWKVGQ